MLWTVWRLLSTIFFLLIVFVVISCEHDITLKFNMLHIIWIFKYNLCCYFFGRVLIQYIFYFSSLFKKYKPNLVNKNIAPRENFTPFTCNTKLYNDLRTSLKNIANRHLMVDCSDQCKVTFSSHVSRFYIWLSLLLLW